MSMTGSYLDPVADLLAANPADISIFLRFGEARIEVRTNSRALLDKLTRYFLDFPGDEGPADITVTALETQAPVFDLPYVTKEREPGKTKIKEQYVDYPDGRVVRKLTTGMVFCFGGGHNYAFGPCLQNDNQVVNFINNRYIERVIRQGSLLFHAAGVAENGRGLVMSGFSGAGKSTLALRIMGHGTDFVSNDRIMVRRDAGGLTMFGIPKMPRVNPGTVLAEPHLASVMSEEERRRFSALPPAELWDLEHKYDAFIDDCYGPGRFRLQSPMNGLVVMTWKRDGRPMRAELVDLAARRDLLPAFMKDVGLFFESDGPGPSGAEATADDYLALLSGCPVLEISGGVDFDAAALACLDFLRRSK
ncbi:HprK-related kinase B [Desulfolutivibrio sulfoxidireducens]|uniref:HprK-related kinase B n=1 Tax=Desulfolutivibrio sulfoxidireducens TaxID=2773299 RepID=UPI00159CFE3F|nr:HprK-related kinase B [Desulfolutivibrio sulfoxidireducens]